VIDFLESPLGFEALKAGGKPGVGSTWQFLTFSTINTNKAQVLLNCFVNVCFQVNS
jgi:hypothetical protein